MSYKNIINLKICEFRAKFAWPALLFKQSISLRERHTRYVWLFLIACAALTAPCKQKEEITRSVGVLWQEEESNQPFRALSFKSQHRNLSGVFETKSLFKSYICNDYK